MSHTPNTFLAPIIIFNILYIQIKNPEKRRKKQENNQDIGLNYVCVCVCGVYKLHVISNSATHNWI